MSKVNKKGLDLLKNLQALYQQKLISSFDKSEIAILIMRGMKSGNYIPVLKRMEQTKCLIPEKEDMYMKIKSKMNGGILND